MIDLFRPIERRSTLANPESWMVDFFGGGATSKAGVRVTPDTALAHSAIFACVQVRSQTLASLPLSLFRRKKDGDKEPAVNHPAYALVHSSPHPQLTSFDFREMVNGHADTRGIGYAQIVRDNGGRLRRLVPLHPDRVTPVRSDKFNADGVRPLFFDVTNAGFGGTARLSEDEMLQIPNFTIDGVHGASPIRLCRDAIGLALATDEHASRMFSNGARPAGVLEHPGKLGEDGRKNLRKSWQEIHGGVENAGRVAILEEAMKFHEVGLSNIDSELLASRKYSRIEIAGLWRVPVHKIGGDDKAATYASVEQFNIQFVQDCMLPLCVRWEQRLDMSLLTEAERGEYFFKFNLAGLMRGAMLDRYNAYRIGLGRAGEPGWITVADIRDVEDMNSIPGTDKLFTGVSPVDVSKTARAFAPLLADALGRAFRKEAKAVRAVAKKPDAASELETFYGEHRRYLLEVLSPAFACARSLGATLPAVESIADKLISESRSEIAAALADPARVETSLVSWETTRAATIAADIIEHVT